MHGHFVASFPYFNGTVSVYVCMRKIIIWTRVSLFRRFTDRNYTYGTGSATKYPRIYGYFIHVQCIYDRSFYSCFFSYCIYVVLLSAQWGGPNGIEAWSLGLLFLQCLRFLGLAANGSLIGSAVFARTMPHSPYTYRPNTDRPTDRTSMELNH